MRDSCYGSDCPNGTHSPNSGHSLSIQISSPRRTSKKEKDIVPSRHWDPAMNAPNLMNESGTQHQQQKEDIDMTPSYLPHSQSFVATAQYENMDLDLSESSSSWVMQGSDKPDAIGSSGDDNDNNNTKMIPKTTRILSTTSSVALFYSEQTTEYIFIFRAHSLNIYLYIGSSSLNRGELSVLPSVQFCICSCYSAILTGYLFR